VKERDRAGTGCGGGESIKTVFKMGLRSNRLLVVPTRATFAGTVKSRALLQPTPTKQAMSHGESWMVLLSPIRPTHRSGILVLDTGESGHSRPVLPVFRVVTTHSRSWYGS